MQLIGQREAWAVEAVVVSMWKSAWNIGGPLRRLFASPAAHLPVLCCAMVAIAGPVLGQPQPTPRPAAAPAPAPVSPAPSPSMAAPAVADRPAISLSGRKPVRIEAPYGFTGSSDFKDHPVVSGYRVPHHRRRHLARVHRAR